MAVAVSVTSDVRGARRRFRQFRDQIPFATARAITKTLLDAKKDAPAGMREDLDRPTPFTLRALRVDFADKRKRPIEGRLFALPAQDAYLRYQVFGGVRFPKGAALTLPPIKDIGGRGGVRLDRYGNIPRSQKARVLLAREGVFSGVVGGVAGIWQRPKLTKSGRVRKGQRLRLLLAYADRAEYEPRWKFHERAARVVDRRFRLHFATSIRIAVTTARRK